MARISALTLFALWALASMCAWAQDRYVEIVQRYGRPQFYLETAMFPTASPDSMRLVVHMKISYDNAFFVKRPDGKFSAELNFSTEALSRQVSVARRSAKRLIVVDSFATTKDRSLFVEATFDLTLKAGEYELFSEIYSDEIQKQIRFDRRSIAPKPKKVVQVSDVVMVYRPELKREPLRFKLLGAAGNGIFGRDYVGLVEIISPQPIDELSWELFEKQGQKEKSIEKKTVPKEAIFAVRSLDVNSDEKQEYSLSAARLERSVRYLAILDFQAEKLANTRFVLKLTARAGKEVTETTKEFENAWIDIPFGLYDITLAIRLMEYILKPEELSEMQSGSAEEQRKKFLDYWKKRDPTPETEFNELMAEYFRRVDYAFFNFYTPREFGWRTDRGKTYILYGEPSSITREFPINRPTQEIWTYNEIKKRFIFADRNNTGNYERIAVEDLP
ncbi:MAG: GWxTD domain-containing protein [Chloroherpetonaceae bacterium]|nr:GWxTD domain-containing protein [Chloroherpetonaceae bacterium]